MHDPFYPSIRGPNARRFSLNSRPDRHPLSAAGPLSRKRCKLEYILSIDIPWEIEITTQISPFRGSPSHSMHRNPLAFIM
jgi:hypothetical protein